MPTIPTLSGRKTFSYTGNCMEGFFIEYTGRPFISSQFIDTVMEHFNGSTVRAGFNMKSPSGFGLWISENTLFSSKHASHIAAVMVHEGLISHSFYGKSINLHFEPR